LIDIANPNSSRVNLISLPNASLNRDRTIAVGPDNWVYYCLPADCNACLYSEPVASIWKFNPEANFTNLNITRVTNGTHNSLGLVWDQYDGLWFLDQGRTFNSSEVLGTPCELNRLAYSSFTDYGFPYCYGGGDALFSDPEFGSVDCLNYQEAYFNLDSDAAPTSALIYQGGSFGAPIGQFHTVLMVEFGTNVNAGHRVTYVDLDDNGAYSYQTFIDGWTSEGKAWGQPYGIAPYANGGIVLSDFQNGLIYLVTYDTGKYALDFALSVLVFLVFTALVLVAVFFLRRYYKRQGLKPTVDFDSDIQGLSKSGEQRRLLK